MIPPTELKYVDAEWTDKYAGDTAIVIGNGESLKKIPRELLNKYPNFGANCIYLFPFQPTYYICIDTRMLRNYPKDIYATAAKAEIAFLSDTHMGEPVEGLEELYQLENAYLCNENTVRFPGEAWWTGGTSAYMALKIAYAMGFSTVILVGCDRDYEWKHFSDDYPEESIEESRKAEFRSGQEYHFVVASIVYKEAGRRIVNLSLPSALDEYFGRGEIEDYA
ncbi:hypothetical protein LCGC14_0507420 [marine sediment metagenome]|uniref:DUF115 domain-containing protein n=1 Tax=marine sediment metagenome TaxID=412755 RepID=A0A0F9S768_9ZZZZ